MSIDIKPCYIYDMMREWLDVYGNQNFEEAKKEYVRAFKELYEYQQKDQKIADLEAKLAEKEKEIKNLNLEAQKYYEDAYCNDSIYQAKISFCIEKLEKVKELMRSIDMPNNPELYYNDMFGAGFDSHYLRVEELIDNQIEELKKEME